MRSPSVAIDIVAVRRWPSRRHRPVSPLTVATSIMRSTAQNFSRRPSTSLAMLPAPTIGTAAAPALPPPSAVQVASGAKRASIRILDTLVLDLVPADVRFLDDIFGVGARAEHAVGKAEESPA